MGPHCIQVSPDGTRSLGPISLRVCCLQSLLILVRRDSQLQRSRRCFGWFKHQILVEPRERGWTVPHTGTGPWLPCWRALGGLFLLRGTDPVTHCWCPACGATPSASATAISKGSCLSTWPLLLSLTSKSILCSCVSPAVPGSAASKGGEKSKFLILKGYKSYYSLQCGWKS